MNLVEERGTGHPFAEEDNTNDDDYLENENNQILKLNQYIENVARSVATETMEFELHQKNSQSFNFFTFDTLLQ